MAIGDRTEWGAEVAEAPTPQAEFRSGFAALVGPPNSGKSTLLNALVGAKVAITSPMPQTTRSPLRGVATLPHAQIVFVDTPGLHRPRHTLGERMLRAARTALADVDVVLFVVDGSRSPGEESRIAAEAVASAGRPTVAVVNKRDVATPHALQTWESWLAESVRPEQVVRTSALRAEGLDEVVMAIVERLPPGPRYFEDDDLTDQPVQALVREVVREKAILLTREEIPHAIAVELDEFRPRPEQGITYIRATLHVERPSQKKILVGGGGRVIREIGTLARQEIEALIGGRVYLDLWVKVSQGWRERESLVRRFYPEV
ncbi:MAG: GTPase Era [Armatimonadota bacterium]|nr:GTPase Era [Armatimonadota bacterium]MDR5697196.1 GTPase Era [Armatimonadota bacterium]